MRRKRGEREAGNQRPKYDGLRRMRVHKAFRMKLRGALNLRKPIPPCSRLQRRVVVPKIVAHIPTDPSRRPGLCELRNLLEADTRKSLLYILH